MEFLTDEEQEEYGWIPCVVDPNYEINVDFPHQIRRESDKRIVNESSSNLYKYVRCRLNGVFHFKHRIIACQFLGLDLEDNTREVDHINGIDTDNRLENIRVVSRSENMLNRNGHFGFKYEFVDEVPEEAIIVREYNGFTFENLHFHDDTFYFFNGVRFRKLRIFEIKGEYQAVSCKAVCGRQCTIVYTKFKREYNL